MEKRIITISREFGSGGRSIGKAVAEKLGIAYYDKELIEQVAAETGYDKKFVEEQGEYAPTKSVFSYAFAGRTINGMSVSDYLWSVQRNIIIDIAEKKSCVIVGRCADFILKERDDVLNVFIHADKNIRAQRIAELYGENDTEPMKRLDEKDKKRAVNYKYYTDQVWGMAKNYHITLDSGIIGMERCVEIISKLYDK